jgi:hypothetical protein
MTTTPHPIYVDCQRPLDEQLNPEQLAMCEEWLAAYDVPELTHTDCGQPLTINPAGRPDPAK